MTKHNYPPANSFHWRDDIFFRVESNGDVRCWKFGTQLFFEMSPLSWDSVVLFVNERRRDVTLAAAASGGDVKQAPAESPQSGGATSAVTPNPLHSKANHDNT